MGLVKRAALSLVRKAVPRYCGGLLDVVEDIHDANQNVRFIRDAIRPETVNELAMKRAAQVEDAMFAGRVVKAIRNERRRKRRRRS